MLFVHPGLCNAPSGRGVTGSQRLRGASRMLARERHRRVWRQNAHASDESPCSAGRAPPPRQPEVVEANASAPGGTIGAHERDSLQTHQRACR